MLSEENGRKEERKTGVRVLPIQGKRAGARKSAGPLLLALFLLGGGLVAWFLMRNAAYSLAGGERGVMTADSNALSAGGALSGEPLAEPAEGGMAGQDAAGRGSSLVPSAGLAGRLSGSAGVPPLGARGTGGNAAGYGAGEGSSASGSGRAGAGTVRGRSAGGKTGGKTAGTEGFGAGQGRLVRVGPSSSKAAGGGAARGGKVSVLDSLKSAFKANLIGARMASQDAARTWMARTFDASQTPRHSLEYSENMKTDLDRLNPRSIPGFLRDQNLDATSAKSLGVAKVQMPDFDRSGTQAALAADSDYQRKKVTQEIISAMFKPMGPFDDAERSSAENGAASSLVGARLGAESINASGLDSWDEPVELPAETPAAPVGGGSGNKPKQSVYQLPPEDQQTLDTDAAQELANTPSVDYGGACGCTKEAPCCCLPPGYLDAKNKEKSGSGTIVMIGADFTPLTGSVGGSVAGAASGGSKSGGK